MNPLYDYCKYKVRHNSNVNIAIIGAVGSGKSFSALRFATDLDPEFSTDRIAFTIKDFYLKVQDRIDNKIPAGSVIMFDEAGIDASSGKHYMDKKIQNLRSILHTFRLYRLITIFTFPVSLGKLSSQVRDCFDIIVDMREINYRDKYSVGIPHIMQINSYSGKEYRHTITTNENGEDVQMASLRIHLPPKELIEEYDKIQERFKRKLLKDTIKFEDEENEQAKKKALGLKYYYDIVRKNPQEYLDRTNTRFSYLVVMVRLNLSEKKSKALCTALNKDWSEGKFRFKF